MNYAELKTFVVSHLWKQGDTLVIAALDQLILLAEAELNRVLKVESRMVQAFLTVNPGNGVATLPDDYQSLRHVSLLDKGPCVYLSPFEFSEKYSMGRPTGNSYYYTILSNTIRIGGKPPDAVNQVIAWYYRKIPNFYLNQGDENNYFVINYPDVFLYTILKHTAPFLREDERLAVWGALGNAALESALDEDTDKKYGGSPLKMNFGRKIR